MMDHRVPYATLLSMLLQELRSSSNSEAICALLKRVRGYSRMAALAIEVQPDALLIDGIPVTTSSGELDLLISCMQLHGVNRISIAEGASSKELLQMAVLLADVPGTRSSDPTIFEQARERSFWDVRFTPVAKPKLEAIPVPGVHRLASLDAEGVAVRVGEMMVLLQRAQTERNAIRATILLRLLTEAESETTDDRRALWTKAVNEAMSAEVLKLIAENFPSAEDRDPIMALFKRAGDAGANALIMQLNKASSTEERRCFFDAICELRAGVPLLKEMLRSPQWFTARNAALLLGEIGATNADTAIAALMLHSDERVRIAATTALSQIDTPAARTALQLGLSDQSADVRRRSLRGFAGDRGRATSAALLKALEGESNPEVQVEILAAMGRMRSPDAIQKLVRLCSPRQTGAVPAEFRIAAAEALTTARGSAALPILREMLDDRDHAVVAGARALISSLSTQVA